jgi:putative heme transporter
MRRPADPHTVERVRAGAVDCRARVVEVVRSSWPQLSFGMVGYAALQALLLWACISAVGGRLSPAQVLAGFAVDRVLTLVVLTPGAVGFTEAGTAAALTALGGVPAVMAAGVLLYRGFTYALEIPVGGLWLGGWLLAHRWRPRSLGGAAA